MDRAEAWATFLLVIVVGLILLGFLGVLVGSWLDHTLSGLLHVLGSPLSLLPS